MSPAWIRVRKHPPTRRHPKGHITYAVLYRRGGRAYKVETAGTFATQRDARTRRDLVSGWLAAGLNPSNELTKLVAAPATRLTVAQWADRYAKSRIDFAAETAKNVRSHLRKIKDSDLAAKPIDAVTTADLQELVADWSESLKPSSLSRYFRTVQLIFDYAGIDPNPARDRRISTCG